MLDDTFELDTGGGEMGSYAGNDVTIGYALTPGYETYQGMGWYGCIAQALSDEASEPAENARAA